MYHTAYLDDLSKGTKIVLIDMSIGTYIVPFDMSISTIFVPIDMSKGTNIVLIDMSIGTYIVPFDMSKGAKLVSITHMVLQSSNVSKFQVPNSSLFQSLGFSNVQVFPNFKFCQR